MEMDSNYEAAMARREALNLAPTRTTAGYLNKIEEMVLGKAVRIEVPVHALQAHQIIELGRELHKVADAIIAAGARHDMDPYHRLLEVRRQVVHYKHRMNDLIGKTK